MQLSWPRQHFFYSKKGLKIQTSFASRHVYGIQCFFSRRVDWKFNLSHGNRHDYDYDYAAASLFPKSRLNFQLSRYLTCQLDSIFFLPKERIENPGSSASRHEYSFSCFPEKWVENSAPLLPLDVDRVFICPKSGLKIQLHQPFFALRYCGQVLFSTERINFLPLDMFRRHLFHFYLKSGLKIQLRCDIWHVE